jgi:hypothetical protein
LTPGVLFFSEIGCYSHKKLGGLRCSGRIGSSCSTDDTCRAILKSPDYHLLLLMPLSTLIGFRVDTWGVVFFWNRLLLAHPCIKFIQLLCHVPNKNNATNILPSLSSHVVFHSGKSSEKQPLSTLCVYFKWRHYSA